MKYEERIKCDKEKIFSESKTFDELACIVNDLEFEIKDNLERYLRWKLKEEDCSGFSEQYGISLVIEANEDKLEKYNELKHIEEMTVCSTDAVVECMFEYGVGRAYDTAIKVLTDLINVREKLISLFE